MPTPSPSNLQHGPESAGTSSVAHKFWQGGVLTLALSLLVAAVLSIVNHGNVAANLGYSLSIGGCCWLAVSGSRWWIARRRALRDPSDEAAAAGWPGWGWMLACLVLGTPAGYAAGSWLGDLITGSRYMGSGLSNWRGWMVFLLVSFAIAAVLTLHFRAKSVLAATQAQAEAALRTAAEHQLRLLETQLEPHMLFNTLANLRVLIALDPPRAQAMLDRLIAYLRATLQASRTGTHALAAEFDRLADYLALMQVRMGERLQVRLELPPELASTQVPTLLLQPLVENAIRHGLEPQEAGGSIHVSAQREGSQLCLRVTDTGIGLPAQPAQPGPDSGSSTGFGLVQVRERLATLYGPPPQAQLRLMPADATGTGTGTCAEVRLPWTATTRHDPTGHAR